MLNSNIEIGQRFKDEVLKNYKSISDFGRIIGKSPQSLNLYFIGERGLSRFGLQEKIKNAGLDLDYILKGNKKTEKDKNIPDGYMETILIKGIVIAGDGSFPEDYTQKIMLPTIMLKGIRNPAIATMSDSMTPEISDKDLLIFEMVDNCRNGDIVICTYNDIVYVKKYIQTSKQLCLRSLNEQFEDIEIDNRKQIIIHGIVKKIIKSV